MSKQIEELLRSIDDGQIAYADEIKSFIDSFVSEKISREDVLNIVLTEWKQNGFTPLSDIKQKLYEKAADDSVSSKDGAEKKELIARLVKGSVRRDALTQFDDKAYAQIMTGCAELYALATDEPTWRIEGDFSNMGGTNAYFKEELERARGMGKRASDGFAQTDSLFAVTAAVSYQAYKDAIKDHPNAKIYAIRSGGDEIRMIITGVPADVMKKASKESAKAVGALLRETGIQTAGNPKDPRRPGFGYADAYVSMRAQDGYSRVDAPVFLDSVIGLRKLVNAAPNLIKAQLVGKDAEGLKKAEEVLQAAREGVEDLQKLGYDVKFDDLFDIGSSSVSQLTLAARDEIAAQTIRMKKMNFDAQKDSYSLFFAENIRDSDVYAEFLRDRNSSLTAAPYEIKYDQNAYYEDSVVAGKRSLHEQYGHLFTQKDAYLLDELAMEYAHKDPVNGLKEAVDLPADMARYVKDAERFAASKNVEGVSEPWLSHLEFGNLAAFNRISHAHGDVLIAHYKEIVCETLKKNGLDGFAHGVYSSGGSKFKLLLPSVYETVDKKGEKTIKTVDEKTLTKILTQINKAVEKEINSKTIVDYFAQRGVSTDFSMVEDKEVAAFLNDMCRIRNVPKKKASPFP